MGPERDRANTGLAPFGLAYEGGYILGRARFVHYLGPVERGEQWRVWLRLAAAPLLVFSLAFVANDRCGPASLERTATSADELHDPPVAPRAARPRPRPDTCLPIAQGRYCESDCREGKALACLALGYAEYESERAIDYFERACKLEHGAACNLAGVHHDRGGGGGKVALERANAYYQKSCHLGDPWGCNNLGFNHIYGRGMSEAPERAFELFSTACDAGNARSCNFVAAAHEQGVGTPEDVALAMEIFGDIGRMGEVKGLHNLGQLSLSVDDDEADALARFERGCELAVASECRSRSYGQAYAAHCALTGAQCCYYVSLFKERAGEDGRPARARAASLGLDVEAFSSGSDVRAHLK